jgi:hypothetical protein
MQNSPHNKGEGIMKDYYEESMKNSEFEMFPFDKKINADELHKMYKRLDKLEL